MPHGPGRVLRNKPLGPGPGAFSMERARVRCCIKASKHKENDEQMRFFGALVLEFFT